MTQGRDPDVSNVTTTGSADGTDRAPRPLAICAHPDLDASAFSRPFFDALDEGRFAKKALARAYPQWRFDIAREQAELACATSLVLIFPIFWYSPPALLQKWIEDVLVEGDVTVRALEGKAVHVVVSTGGSAQAYSAEGKNGSTIREFLQPIATTFRFFGARVEAPLAFHATWQLAEEEVRALAKRFSAEFAT